MAQSKFIFGFVLFMLIILLSFSENYVVINSQDGMDVLNGIVYANIMGYNFNFVPTSGSTPNIIASKVGSNKNILLIESVDMPVSGFIEPTLKEHNNSIEKYLSKGGFSSNIYLAKRSGVNKFIVVDPYYADSAISVIPYAKQIGAFILFADKDHIKDVLTVLNSDSKIIGYGYLDSKVRSALEPYSPTYIGDGKDRYDDNMELVDLMMNKFGFKQITMYDGSYIEVGSAKGDYPILLMGNNLIPSKVQNFVKNKVSEGKLSVIVILNMNYATQAYSMKTNINNELEAKGNKNRLGVLVKFGQAVSGSSSVFGLDTFPLPANIARLNISNVVYNNDSKQLMVTVENTGDGPAYFIADIHVKVDGKDYKVFYLKEPTLIEKGDKKGLSFDLDLSNVDSGKVHSDVLLRFGTTKGTQESYVSGSYPLVTIKYTDESSLEATAIFYDSKNHVLSLNVKNNGSQEAFVLPTVELYVGGEKVTLKSNIAKISPNSMKIINFPIKLSEEDLAQNNKVTAMLEYGAKEGFLIHKDKFVIPMEYANKSEEKQSMDYLLILILLAILSIAIVAYYFLRGKK